MTLIARSWNQYLIYVPVVCEILQIPMQSASHVLGCIWYIGTSDLIQMWFFCFFNDVLFPDVPSYGYMFIVIDIYIYDNEMWRRAASCWLLWQPQLTHACISCSFHGRGMFLALGGGGGRGLNRYGDIYVGGSRGEFIDCERILWYFGPLPIINWQRGFCDIFDPFLS